MTLYTVLISFLLLIVLMFSIKNDKSPYAFSILRKIFPSFLFHQDVEMDHDQRTWHEESRVKKAKDYFNGISPEFAAMLHRSLNRTIEPSGSTDGQLKFCISIPTVTRGRNYLDVLLHSILANTSMSDLLPNANIAVNVYDATNTYFKSDHIDDNLRKIFNIFHRDDIKNNPKFFENRVTDTDVNSFGYFQKQSLHYITALEYCAHNFPHMDYIIVIEDDAVVPKGWIDSIREMIHTINHDFYGPGQEGDEDKTRLFKGKSFMWIKLYFAHAYNDYNEKRLHLLSSLAVLIASLITFSYIFVQYRRMKHRRKHNLVGDPIILNRCTVYFLFLLCFVISLLFLLLIRFHYLEAKFIKLAKFFEKDSGTTSHSKRFHLQRNFPHYGSALAMVYPNKRSTIMPFIDYLKEWQPQASSTYPNDRIIYNYVYWYNYKKYDNFLVIPDLVEHLGYVSSRGY